MSTANELKKVEKIELRVIQRFGTRAFITRERHIMHENSHHLSDIFRKTHIIFKMCQDHPGHLL
jgi:hypothetical protein